MMALMTTRPSPSLAYRKRAIKRPLALPGEDFHHARHQRRSPVPRPMDESFDKITDAPGAATDASAPHKRPSVYTRAPARRRPS